MIYEVLDVKGVALELVQPFSDFGVEFGFGASCENTLYELN
jgi:hypothetical protein